MRTISCLLIAVVLAVAPLSAYSISTYKWATAPTWRINTNNYNNLDPVIVEAEARASLQAWATASGFAFSWAGHTTSTVTAVDGQNVVIFRNTLNPSNSSALASTYCWYKSGQRYDCDVTIWQKRWFTGATGCSDGYFLTDILTHEFGHTVGVQHSSVSGATMYYRAGKCSTALRSLATDDINAVKALYQ